MRQAAPSIAGDGSVCPLFVPGDVGPNDRFGSSIGVDGDSLAAGSWLADEQGLVDAGSVTTFDIGADGTVSEQQRLVAGNPQPAAHFGFSVDLDGDILAVGAVAEPVEVNGEPLAEAGAVYVFERSGPGQPWAQVTRLTAGDPGAEDGFGYSLEVDAGTGAIIVGAQGDDVSVGDTAEGAGGGGSDPIVDGGSAYLFVRDGAGLWNQAAKLVDPAARAGDRAGHDVAISGQWLVVGHHLDDQVGGETINNAGGALIYEWQAGGTSTDGGQTNQTTVSEPLEVTGSAPMARDRSGVGVDVDGDLLVLTGWSQQPGDRHVLWVFRNGADQWVEEARIELADNEGVGTQFGRHVELADGVIAVGASGDAMAAPGGGAVHFFAEAAGEWGRVARLAPDGVTPDAQAGISVGLSSRWAAIGAERAQLGTRNSGGVCVTSVADLVGQTNAVVADPQVTVFLDAGELEPAPAGAYAAGPLDRLTSRTSSASRLIVLGLVAAGIAVVAAGLLLLRSRARRRPRPL